MSRNEKLTPESKRFISKLLDDNPKISAKSVRKLLRDFLIKDEQNKNTHLAVSEATRIVDAEDYPYLPVENTIGIFIKPIREKILLNIEDPKPPDTPWNTASLDISSLNIEPFSPDSITLLMQAQNRRRIYLSKPLTIREAKWFNRLTGFKDMLFLPASVQDNSEAKSYFIINYLATWAHNYAYREKLDSLSGIEVPSYSDLDNAFIERNYQKIDELRKKIENDFLNSPDMKIALGEFDENKHVNFDHMNQVLSTCLTGQCNLFEQNILGHNLGDPDIAGNERLGAYGELLSITIKREDYFKKLVGFEYLRQLLFIVELRKWANERSNDDFIYNDDHIFYVNAIQDLLQRISQMEGKNK